MDAHAVEGFANRGKRRGWKGNPFLSLYASASLTRPRARRTTLERDPYVALSRAALFRSFARPLARAFPRGPSVDERIAVRRKMRNVAPACAKTIRARRPRP